MKYLSVNYIISIFWRTMSKQYYTKLFSNINYKYQQVANHHPQSLSQLSLVQNIKNNDIELAKPATKKLIIADIDGIISKDPFIIHKTLYTKHKEHIIFIQYGNVFFVYEECALKIKLLGLDNVVKIKQINEIFTHKLIIKIDDMNILIEGLLNYKISSILVTQFNNKSLDIKRKPTAIITNINELRSFNFANLITNTFVPNDEMDEKMIAQQMEFSNISNEIFDEINIKCNSIATDMMLKHVRETN